MVKKEKISKGIAKPNTLIESVVELPFPHRARAPIVAWWSGLRLGSGNKEVDRQGRVSE
jgi:hypothetical protein